MHISSKVTSKGLLAACLLSAAGALIFNAFPLFLSSIADQFKLNDEQLGLLGTAYLGGFALISLVAVFWMSRVNWKIVSFISYVLICGGMLSLNWVESPNMVFVAMAVIGVGSGIIFTIATTVAGYASDPDRAFGLKLVAEMSVAAVLIFVMTAWIIKNFGFTGFAVGVTILYAITMAVVPFLPQNLLSEPEDSSEAPARGDFFAAWLAVIGLFLQFSAFSALWGFMERIGAANGVTGDAIGTTLTVAVLTGIVGAMLGAFLGNRYGTVKPLMISFLLTIAAALIMKYSSGLMTFTIGACAVSGLIQFWATYQMGLIAAADTSGTFTVMIAFILSAGGALGPGIAGGIVESSGFGPVYLMVVGVSVVCALMAVIAGNRLKKAIDMA